MDKKVSLIIVSHDLELYLNNCIRAIEANTGRCLIEEIVVVDNASTVRLAAQNLRYLTALKVILIRLEQNTSYAFANNRGVEASRGCYICFMNNDVEVLPGWLLPLYRALDTNPQVGAVGPKMIFPDGSVQFAGYEKDCKTGFQRHRLRKSPTHHSITQANVGGCVSSLTGACLLVRREDAHFDERYWYGCEDVDLCAVLKQKNKIIFYEPRSVVIHHEEKSRASGMVPIDYEGNRHKFREKWGKDWEHHLWSVVR